MGLRRLDLLTALAAVVTIIGALNWGFLGLFGLNPVRRLLGGSEAAVRSIYGLVGLSGLWLAIQMVLPFLLTTTSRGTASPTVLPGDKTKVGQRFPSIEGRKLTGEPIKLPDDLAGKVALLALGFTYDSRYDVESWTEAFRHRFAGRPDVTWLQMPMVGGAARLAEPMIDTGMRQATPLETREHVVTVYGDMGPVREALGAVGTSDTWIYLLDQDGRIIFQLGGGLNRAQFEELASAAGRALASRRFAPNVYGGSEEGQPPGTGLGEKAI